MPSGMYISTVAQCWHHELLMRCGSDVQIADRLFNPLPALLWSAGTAQDACLQRQGQTSQTRQTYGSRLSAEPHPHSLYTTRIKRQGSRDGLASQEEDGAASIADSRSGSTMSGLEGLVHWEANSSVSSATSLHDDS